MIDIVLLGTAATMPLPDRALTAAALLCGGRAILFDCGEGTQSAARAAGVSLMKADVIALTHYHGDHIFGLPGLLQSMDLAGRQDPLLLTGPEGIEEAMAPILALAGRLRYEVRTARMPAEGLRPDRLDPAWPGAALLTAFPTDHRVPSLGYRFRLERPGRFLPQLARERGVPVQLWKDLQQGREVRSGGAVIRPSEVLGPPRRGLTFVFSGDTRRCAALEEAARDADLLVCEATYAEDEREALAEERGHMTFAHAGQTAAAAGARRLWLAHYSQMIASPEEQLHYARAFFPAAECGRDGMRITLGFDRE